MCVLTVKENTVKSVFLKNFKMITNENCAKIQVRNMSLDGSTHKFPSKP